VSEPICFGCKHFRQRQPLHFLTPGECGWGPGPSPEWLQSWLDSDDKYYGPKREIWTRGHIITDCPVFERAASPSDEDTA